jgi:hypothetical protein
MAETSSKGCDEIVPITLSKLISSVINLSIDSIYHSVYNHAALRHSHWESSKGALILESAL